MKLYLTRRNFLSTCIGGSLLTAADLRAQTADIPIASMPFREPPARSTVALVTGPERRKNVTNALLAIDDLVRPKLKVKKRVLIKVNNVSTNNQLAATHIDCLRGVLDYLEPRFKGPVTIGESSAGNTLEGFSNFGYANLTTEYKSNHVDLIDFNSEGKYVNQLMLDQNAHPIVGRLAARLFDPEAFVICATIPKTHNYAVATLSVKNMVLGSALHQGPKATETFNHKRFFHAGFHLVHYNMLMTAQSMSPHWGVAVLDAFQGMEGDGPVGGTAVDSRIAIASTDFIAADRVGLECMGIDPTWVGYLRYSNQMGLGNYDLARIDLRGGVPIASVQKNYRMHADVRRELTWSDPASYDDGSWMGAGRGPGGGRGEPGRGGQPGQPGGQPPPAR